MAVCSFFLRGQCKFGTACRNEHPPEKRPFGTTAWAGGRSNAQTLLFNAETMAKDFDPTIDKPMWPLSCYGPSKHEPNLIPPLDESPEELRMRAFQARQANAVAEYVKYEEEKIAGANQVYAAIKSNAKDAFEHARKQSSYAGTQAPSITPTPFVPHTSSAPAFGGTQSAFGGGGGGGGAFGTSAFGGGNTSAFAKPTAFGQPAFGQSAFGGSSQPAPAFGQPSQPTSAFGQPSQPAATSAFGQPSQPTSAFGQPSAFGQAAQPPTSAFGQTSQPASAFGQSSFGKPATPGAFGTSAFGSAAPNPSTSGAGTGTGGGFAAFAGNQPSAFGGTAAAASSPPAFGQSAFGGGNATATSAFGGNAAGGSVFGQPSAFGAQPQPTQPQSVFGQPAGGAPSAFGQTQPTSAFGQPAQSAFGQSGPSAFSQPAQSAFGQPAQSAFSQPAQSAFSQPAQSAFSQPAQSAFGPSALSQPPAQPHPQPRPPGAGPGGPKATSGRPDFARARDSVQARPGADPYDVLLPPGYAGLVPAAVREAFASLSFEWGKVPDWIPPMEMR